MGKGWADIHIGKGVFGRFGFGDSRISQIHRQVKNKATGTPQGMYSIQPSLSSDAKTFVGREGILYTYIGVGAFSVVRFRLVGQCESL